MQETNLASPVANARFSILIEARAGGNSSTNTLSHENPKLKVPTNFVNGSPTSVPSASQAARISLERLEIEGRASELGLSVTLVPLKAASLSAVTVIAAAMPPTPVTRRWPFSLALAGHLQYEAESVCLSDGRSPVWHFCRFARESVSPRVRPPVVRQSIYSLVKYATHQTTPKAPYPMGLSGCWMSEGLAAATATTAALVVAAAVTELFTT